MIGKKLLMLKASMFSRVKELQFHLNFILLLKNLMNQVI